MSLNRRELLVLLGGAPALSLLGCRQAVAACVVSPAQTEGPFFVDEELERSDIRIDPSDGSSRPGVPLDLALTVFQNRDGACAPLPNARVDIWHCDALGVYSDVRNNTASGGDTRGRKFLRGYQVTDAAGRVAFRTVYPGWYRGRPVHIHYKVRTNPSSEAGREFTSQLYFDEAVTDAVHGQAPYLERGRRDSLLAGDGIYRRGGSESMLRLTKTAKGYSGTYDVGLGRSSLDG